MIYVQIRGESTPNPLLKTEEHLQFCAATGTDPSGGKKVGIYSIFYKNKLAECRNHCIRLHKLNLTKLQDCFQLLDPFKVFFFNILTHIFDGF